jgi:SAM-dependent methyltransferase
MLRRLFLLLPERAKEPVMQIGNFMMSLLYRGEGRWCPVCENPSRKFHATGIVPREDAKCLFCGALERHRFVWLYISKMTNLFDGIPKKMLHVAPERCFESRLKKHLGKNYITADIQNPRAMVRMDITNIQYPDEYFDVIFCSHVLEHVQDDKKAIREFYRVLKHDGWAILLVPITAEKTIEDSSIINPSERFLVFGQEDHVRRYGPDYIDRLQEAGFKIKITRVPDLFNTSEIVQMGLTPASGKIYYCTKV